jgi:hypothetical protein
MGRSRYETELFMSQMSRFTDKAVKAGLEDAITKILEHPELSDGQLKGPRAGSFKKKVFQKKYRILFRYCDFCLKVRKVRCSDCAEQKRPENSLVFLEAFHRKDDYD